MTDGNFIPTPTHVEQRKNQLEAIVRLAVPMLATILGQFGLALDTELWLSVALSAVGIIGLIWAWWYNNSMTTEAMMADEWMYQLKQATSDAVAAAEDAEGKEAE